MVLMILAAVSGTGKSTVARRLLAAAPDLRLSVSHTTRAPRPGEQHGVHYHYVSRATFDAEVSEGVFVEWAEYADQRYGTSRRTIAAAEAAGHDLLFDVEVVGAANLKAAYPQAVSVFLLPPSWRELERRLRGRGTEAPEVIERRLARGRMELDAAPSFDHLVVNADLGRAVEAVTGIYRAARAGRPDRAQETLAARSLSAVTRLQIEAAEAAAPGR